MYATKSSWTVANWVDYSIELISQPGSRITELSTTMETRDAEIRMLEVQQERESGVNMDEELGIDDTVSECLSGLGPGYWHRPSRCMTHY